MEKMKKTTKRVLSLMLMLVMCITVIGVQSPTDAEAASKIKRSAFIVSVVKAMDGQKTADGKTIKIVLNKDGSVSYLNKMISASTVNSIKSKYGVKLATAQYLAVAKDMKLYSASSTYYKSKAAMGKNATRKVALVVLVKAYEYLNGKIDSATVKLAKTRISNLKSAGSSTFQTYMAKAYAIGLYNGTKGAAYSTTRKFAYSTVLTTTTAKKLVARLTDASKRTLLSDDLQVIRTTNLPRTADLYPYILDSYPNAYYDTAWRNMGDYVSGTGINGKEYKNSEYYKESLLSFKERSSETGHYIWPYEFKAFCMLGDNETSIPSKYRDYDALCAVVDEAIEYYKHAMNVDYRTIEKDTEWQDFMLKYLTKEQLNTYISDCKKNKIIVECDVVAGDKSTIYDIGDASFKLYLHFRVVSDKILETKSEWVYGNSDGDFVPMKMQIYENGSRLYLMNRMGYKVGEWVDYYVSPTIGYGFTLQRADLQADLMKNYFGLYPELYDAGY